MAGIIGQIGAGRSGLDLSSRGYQVLFRANECNRCPGCGRAQWYVGRVTAECVFCGTALPLAEARWGRSGATWTHERPGLHEDLPLQALGTAERRRQARKSGEGRIVNLLLDGMPRAFEVHNYSASGVMLAADPTLKKAKQVEIIAPSGEIVAAEVRWTGSDFSGLQFAKALPLVLSPTHRAV
jgi:hypothetical protein